MALNFKRFLNVQYNGTKTEIDILGLERLGPVITATKAYYGEDIPGPAARIQLLDTENTRISTWKQLKELPVPYFEESGL
jgi:hypothetical protein